VYRLIDGKTRQIKFQGGDFEEHEISFLSDCDIHDIFYGRHLA
jgi:hypothetical protein